LLVLGKVRWFHHLGYWDPPLANGDATAGQLEGDLTGVDSGVGVGQGSGRDWGVEIDLVALGTGAGRQQRRGKDGIGR